MKYNYFYNGNPISRDQFISNVPENWESEIDQYGNYSWGYYRASERD